MTSEQCSGPWSVLPSEVTTPDETTEVSEIDSTLSIPEAGKQPSSGSKDASTQTETSVIELFKRYVTHDWVSSATGPCLPINPNFTRGDIVLVSSDNVGFAFLLAVLAYRSPVFRGLSELPRTEDSSRVLPISMASAKTLEALLARLDPSHKEFVTVPSVEVLDELLAVIDAFDFQTSIIKVAVYNSGLNVGVKYAFASAFDPTNETKWALECLDTRDVTKCEVWAQHPEAHRTLPALFRKWQAAGPTFVKMYKNTAVNGHDDFGKRCRKKSCDAFEQAGGDWSALKTNVAEALVGVMMDSPKSGKERIAPACHELVDCWSCAHRLSMHGVSVWKKLVLSGQWRR